MKKHQATAFIRLLGAASLLHGCGLFDRNSACSDAVCPESDIVKIEYISATDSTTNLLGSGQISLNAVSVTPMLHDKDGPMPFILIAKIGPQQIPTVNITVNDNLRGLTLRLSGLPPDTILMTTGLRPAEPCCSETATVSQLLANGQVVPSIGSAILVNFYK